MRSVYAKAFAPERVATDFRLALFHGPDESTGRELSARLAARIVPADDAMAVTYLAADVLKDDPARLADEAASVSMFGGQRLIRIDGAGDECLDAVSLLLGAAVAGNPVIILAPKLTKGSKLLAKVESDPAAHAIVCWETDARDMPRLVADIGRDFGLDISRDAAAMLVAATAGDRAILRREIEKCALYVDAAPDRPGRLSAADVTRIGADTPDSDFGAFIEAIVSGRLAAADQQLRRMQDGGVAGIALLRQVIRRLFTLIELRQLVDAGQTPRAAVDAARPPVFWKEKDAVTAQLGRWRTAALRHALERLLGAERDIKRSGAAGEVLAWQALLAVAVQAARL